MPIAFWLGRRAPRLASPRLASPRQARPGARGRAGRRRSVFTARALV